MPAVAALPHLYLALFKYRGGLHVLQQCAVSFFVVSFHLRDQTEFFRQLREALFLGGLGKSVVHIGPLVVFAGRGGSQVLLGIADPLQLLEPHLRVLFFVFRGLQEQSRDLLIAFLFGDGGKISVFISGLRFPRKRRFQILFGLGAGIFMLGLFHLFKGRRGLLAERADIIRRELLSFINITAYFAFPLCHGLFLLVNRMNVSFLS